MKFMIRYKSLISRALLPLSVLLLFVGAAIPTATAAYSPQTLNAGGSTFVAPVMDDWVVGFKSFTSNLVTINYAAVGSTSGQKGVLKKLYAFGASDAPISSSLYTPNYTAAYGPLVTIPEALGGVAIFYNIPGLSASHPLNLTGQVVADIYLKSITTWNASAILALNPYYTAAQLSYSIIPVHRSDGSGTTYALTTYFERTSNSSGSLALNNDWNASGLGRGTLISWPSGELGASGSGGVAGDVSSNTGAIGYADSYYALSNHLTSAYIQNSAGKFQQPTLTTIAAAAAADSAKVLADPTYSITDAPGATSYPISTYTYILVWANQTNYDVGYDVANFIWYVVTDGQAYGPSLNYPALPSNIVTIDENLITELNYQGTPFITIASASVSCTPISLTVGLHTKCTASVTGGTKGGVVSWATNATGTFSKPSCDLSAHLSCSVTFTSGEAGTVDMLASYQGSGGAAVFNGQTTFTVTQKASRTTLSCKPGSEAISGTSTCTATVVGYRPTGTVTFSQTGAGSVSFSSASCTLAPVGHSTTSSKCSVTATGVTAGSVTVGASYSGDTNNAASSTTHPLTVR